MYRSGLVKGDGGRATPMFFKSFKMVCMPHFFNLRDSFSYALRPFLCVAIHIFFVFVFFVTLGHDAPN